MGAHAVENDVYLSSDGEIVVIHNRTTEDVYGDNLVVQDSTVEQLKKLRPVDRYNGEYLDQTVPTLEEVYMLMKKYPTVTINVELKSVGEEFLKKVLEVTEKCKMTHRVIFSAFDVVNLEWLCKNASYVPTAYLTDNKNIAPAIDNKCVAVHPYTSAVDKEYVETAHKHNLEVNVWTVNDAKEIKRVMDCGIDGIITDCPDIALEVIENQ